MTDTITVQGIVATNPRHLVTSEGLAITTFRLASGLRRFDQTTMTWVDGPTNWYTVTSFRQLALNVVASINKGDGVVAAGVLRLREFATAGGAGVTAEVEASSIGHDLAWGTTTFTRSERRPDASQPQ